MFESLWAAFTLGAIWVPTNYRLTPPEVAYLAASSGAKAMICDDAFPQHADAAQQASSALRVTIAIGTPRAGELAYEDLVAEGSGGPRSDEHTSELQSLMRISYAVFCLKKKTTTSKKTTRK